MIENYWGKVTSHTRVGFPLNVVNKWNYFTSFPDSLTYLMEKKIMIYWGGKVRFKMDFLPRVRV